MSSAHTLSSSYDGTQGACADALAEPKPTVREAMRFEPFASAKLVAGADGLDRPIEWVRVDGDA